MCKSVHIAIVCNSKLVINIKRGTSFRSKMNHAQTPADEAHREEGEKMKLPRMHTVHHIMLPAAREAHHLGVLTSSRAKRTGRVTDPKLRRVFSRSFSEQTCENRKQHIRVMSGHVTCRIRPPTNARPRSGPVLPTCRACFAPGWNAALR